MEKLTRMFSTIERPFLRRTPLVLQNERNDCALACLCMLLQYFGKPVSLSTLRHRYGASGRGTTLKQLMAIAEAEQLVPHAYRVDMRQVNQLQLPCILHWQGDHFVVLSKWTKHSATIHDPALGVRRLSHAEFQSAFAQVAVTMTPNTDFTQAQAPAAGNLRFRDLWQRSHGLGESLLLLLLLSLAIQLLALTSPYYTQIVIDEVIVHYQTDLLLFVAAGFFLLMLTETALSLLRRATLLRFSAQFSIQLSLNLFAHLLRLPSQFFARRDVADILSRFRSLNALRDLLTMGGIGLILDGFTGLLVLVVMFLYSPKLAALILIASLLYLSCRLLTLPVQQRLLHQQLLSEAREQNHFMESVRAIQTIKRLQLERLRYDHWLQHLSISHNMRLRSGKWDIYVLSLQQLIVGSEFILLVYVAASSVISNDMTLGMLYAFLAYRHHFSRSLENIVATINEFKMVKVHLQRLADIVHEPKQQDMSVWANDSDVPQMPMRFRAHQVGFRHGRYEPWLFHNITLNIHPGSCIAIIGASGAGKTTLLKCLMGLIPTTVGSLFYGDSLISSPQQLQRISASVMQDDDCFCGTVAENITAFSDTPDTARLRWAAQQACIFDDIQKMPLKFSTWLEDMGRNLSGGQRQRLLLARALYRNPCLLFLDEATSHLDVETEQIINNNLASLNITRIVIAHRPQTIAMAEQVFLLRDGVLRPVEQQQLPPQLHVGECL